MSKVLLIVGGGVAAYKALELVRLMRKDGMEVRAILTEGGAHFVTPLSLASLSERQHVAPRKLLRGVANGHCGMAIKNKQRGARDLGASQDHPGGNADRPGIQPGVNHVIGGDMDLRQLAHLGLKSADTLHCGGRRRGEDAAQNGEIAHGRSSWRNARLVSRNPLLRSSTAARLPPVGALTSRPTAPR